MVGKIVRHLVAGVAIGMTFVGVGCANRVSTETLASPPSAAHALASEALAPTFSALKLRRERTKTSLSIDVIHQDGEGDETLAAAPPTATFVSGKAATISGWAIDRASARPASAVYLTVDGIVKARCTYGVSRPDVATALAGPQYAKSGFGCALAPASIPAGSHAIGLVVVTASGKSYYDMPYATRLDVRAGS